MIPFHRSDCRNFPKALSIYYINFLKYSTTILALQNTATRNKQQQPSDLLLFESAKAIVQLVNVMKMESSGFGLAHKRITTNVYLNGNKLATSHRAPMVSADKSAPHSHLIKYPPLLTFIKLSVHILPMTDTNHKNGNLLR